MATGGVLAYKVPAEPNRHRIALWRKLKGMGAGYLQNGVCLLPKTDEHRRALKLIDNEISEMGGESILLDSAPLDQAQAEKIVARFRAERDEAYRELLDRCDDFEAEIAKEIASDHYSYAEIEENDLDLKKLKAWFEKIQRLDFYGCKARPCGSRTIGQLRDAIGRLRQRDVLTAG
ncbi:Chromate resistance protein ChrB [Rhizobium sp. BK399]|uniref:Chromate resistance protein ChrB n=1 Tax=Rhizobium sp. BK399 TaxID=2587063 RepID=UPI001797984D|nr:hypothetical protein [Rhizobium sp. BK399]